MSFVSENNSLSGYKTCIDQGFETSSVYLTEKCGKQPRHCSIQDSCGHLLPNLDSTIFGPWTTWLFGSIFCPQVSLRSDVGAWWCPTHSPTHSSQSMLVWNGLGNLVKALYFGLVFYLFVVVFMDCSFSPRKILASIRCRIRKVTSCKPVKRGRWNGGLPLSVSFRKETVPMPLDVQVSGTLFSSGALVTAAAIFITFLKLGK